MKDVLIGGKPDRVRPPPLPPLFPVESLVRQIRLIHVAFVVIIIGLGTAWGLKLEYRMDRARDEYDRLSDRVAELERAVSHGILPLTEERITRLGVRLEQIADDHWMMRDRLEAVAAAVQRVSLLQTECALATERRRSRTAR